jgi:hypothetical protein
VTERTVTDERPARLSAAMSLTVAALPASWRHTCHRAGSPLGAPTARWENNARFACAQPSRLTNWDWPGSPQEQLLQIDGSPRTWKHPGVEVKTVWDDDYLGVMFRVDDHYVRCECTQFQDQVSRDSCCEFFIAPVANSLASSPYFNFEVSANGTMLVYYCTDANRVLPPVQLPIEEWATIKMAASLVSTVGTPILPEIRTPTTWSIEYHIPWSLLTRYSGCGSPNAGTTWSCNFFKCGSATSHPHWGTWAQVPLERPAFHTPEFFGAIDFSPETAAGMMDVGTLSYTILLCDDIDAMRKFYTELLPRFFPGALLLVSFTRH